MASEQQDHRQTAAAVKFEKNNLVCCVVCARVLPSTTEDGMCEACNLKAQIAVLQGNLQRHHYRSNSAAPPFFIDLESPPPNLSVATPSGSSLTSAASSIAKANYLHAQPPADATNRNDQPPPLAGNQPSFVSSIISRYRPIIGTGSDSRNHGCILVLDWGLCSSVNNLSALTNQQVYQDVPACVPKDLFTADARVLLEEQSLLRHKFNSATMGQQRPAFVMAITKLKTHFNSVLRNNMREAMTESARLAAPFTGYCSLTKLISQSDLEAELKCRGRPHWFTWWNQVHSDHCANWAKGHAQNNLDILTMLAMEAMGIEYRVREKGVGCFRLAATKLFHNECTFLRSFNPEYRSSATAAKVSKEPDALRLSILTLVFNFYLTLQTFLSLHLFLFRERIEVPHPPEPSSPFTTRH
jgi:hypothetical protein